LRIDKAQADETVTLLKARAEAADELAEAERVRREAVENQQREERLLQARTAEAQAERLQETTDALMASRQREESMAAREAEALASAQEVRNENRRASERLAELMERDSAEKSMIQMRLLALVVENSNAVQTASECYEDGMNLVQEFQAQLASTVMEVDISAVCWPYCLSYFLSQSKRRSISRVSIECAIIHVVDKNPCNNEVQ
jgi:chromosome segregation ATPase